jgi:hypothetical protein
MQDTDTLPGCHLSMRTYSPEEKGEVRQELIAMLLHNSVAELETPEGLTSGVHLQV